MRRFWTLVWGPWTRIPSHDGINSFFELDAEEGVIIAHTGRGRFLDVGLSDKVAFGGDVLPTHEVWKGMMSLKSRRLARCDWQGPLRIGFGFVSTSVYSLICSV